MIMVFAVSCSTNVIDYITFNRDYVFTKDRINCTYVYYDNIENEYQYRSLYLFDTMYIEENNKTICKINTNDYRLIEYKFLGTNHEFKEVWYKSSVEKYGNTVIIKSTNIFMSNIYYTGYFDIIDTYKNRSIKYDNITYNGVYTNCIKVETQRVAKYIFKGYKNIIITVDGKWYYIKGLGLVSCENTMGGKKINENIILKKIIPRQNKRVERTK